MGAQKNGAIGMDEHKIFMERIMECGVNTHWGTFSMKIPGRVGYQCSNYWRQMMKDQWVKDPNYWIRADGSFCFKRAKKGSVPDAIRKYSFVVLKDPSKTFEEPGYHPKRPSDSKLTKYLQDNVRDIVNKKKGGKNKAKKTRTTKNSGGDGVDNKDETTKEKKVRRTKNNNKKPKDPNKPKNPQSSYLLYCNDVRARFQSENKGKGMGQISKLIGAEWKTLSDDDKKQYIEKAKELRTEWNEKMDEYKKSDQYKEYMDVLKKWNEDQMKEEDNEQKEDEDKNEKVEKIEDKNENESDKENENENNEETQSKARGKKRKHSSDEDTSDLEPPQKKRKISPKKKKSKKKKAKKAKKEEVEEENGPLNEVLGDMVDIMTGDKLVQPAISPYGHVMEYNSWCSVLRNARTKNKCPFTKKKLTRRSLIKLNEENIDEYKDKIVNITAEDMKCLKE